MLELHCLFAEQTQNFDIQGSLHWVITALVGGSASGVFALIQWGRKKWMAWRDVVAQNAPTVLAHLESVGKCIAVLSVHAPQVIEVLQAIAKHLEDMKKPEGSSEPSTESSPPEGSPQSAAS